MMAGTHTSRKETEMNATYTKLKDGSWGVRIEGTLDKGAKSEVTVTKRSGETKTESVIVLWSGNGVSLAKIVKSGHSGVGGYNRYTGRSYTRFNKGRRRERYQEDEGCSWPCHTCGKLCFSGEHGYCPNNR